MAEEKKKFPSDLLLGKPFQTLEDFKAGYQWTADQIYSYLGSLINYLPGSKGELAKLYNELILAVWNTRANPRDVNWWLPRMARYRKNSNAILDPVNIEWIGIDEEQKFVIEIFDVYTAVGYILSQTVVYQKPSGTLGDGANFFLPLLAMYGSWCYTLSADASAWSTCPPPMMISVSWVTPKGQEAPRFLLGTSIGGSYFADNRENQLPLRQSIIHTVCPKTTTTPAPWNNGRSHIDWGHCGETYPFYILLSSPQDLRKSVCGMSIRMVPNEKKGGLRNLSTYDRTKTQQCVSEPCANCYFIISTLGGKGENYGIP